MVAHSGSTWMGVKGSVIVSLIVILIFILLWGTTFVRLDLSNHLADLDFDSGSS
jgi:hypothetical protein